LTGGNAAAITTRSIIWGALTLTPLAALEWAAGARPTATPSAIVGTLYLALVITAGGYLVWNWALARVEAARAAPFLTVQPLVGALLAALILGEPVTRFTAIGGALVILGLWMTVTGRR
jgi:drug/metabolite transporter (DMT)-like permease